MKYSKNELKGLIKECLIELLAEGLGGQLVESVSRRQSSIDRLQPRRQQMSPLPRQQSSQRPSVTQALQEAIKTESKGNSVMADILADTAVTTLQQQIQAEGRGPGAAGDAVTMAIAEVPPEELFGEETTSKWAELAFSSTGPRPSS